MAAGFKLASIKKYINSDKLIRIMPNTPAKLGLGVIAVSYAQNVDAEEKQLCRELLANLGQCFEGDEQQLNVIKQFKLEQKPIGHSFSTDEIIDAARCFGELSNGISVRSRYQRFRAVCMSWFSFMEVITGKDKSYPGSNYVDMFCEWHLTSKGSSVGATVHICQELDRFFAYINSKSVTINLLTAACIDGYIETYQSACFARKTVASKVSILRTFLRYLYNRSIIKTDMSSYLISPRIYTCEILSVSPNENDLNRISHFYDGNTPSAIRNKAILLLLIEYGMRSGGSYRFKT